LWEDALWIIRLAAAPPDPLPLRGGGKRMRATVVVINRNVNSVILGTIAILNSIQDRPATRERL